MPMRVRALALAAVGGTVLLSFAAVRNATATKPFASDVSRTPAFMVGEPTVAINPTNARNVLVTYTRSIRGSKPCWSAGDHRHVTGHRHQQSH
jgi:hypothetical protein